MTPDTPGSSQVTEQGDLAGLKRTPTIPMMVAVVTAPFCPHCWLPCSSAEKHRCCASCQRVFHEDCLLDSTCGACDCLRRCVRLYGGTVVCGSIRRQVGVDVGGLCALLKSREISDLFLRNCLAATSEPLLSSSTSLLNDTACAAWDGDRDENQDVGFFPDGDVAIKLFCVFDGHGVGGQVAAQFGVDDLVRRVVFHRMCLQDPQNEGHVQESLRTAFAETQKALLELLTLRKLECGSTVVLAQVVGSLIIVANVGDSRAVLIRKENDDWNTVALSEDHSFNRPDECKRIQDTSKGEIVVGAGNMKRVVPGGGFPREEIKRQALALNMTRAIGHPVLSQYGVSPEPEFRRSVIGPGDRLILASDGLWDVMQNEEAALFCSYRSSASKCAQGLLKVARSKYQKNRMRADNTTICVGYVSNSSEASTPSSQLSSTPSLETM